METERALMALREIVAGSGRIYESFCRHLLPRVARLRFALEENLVIVSGNLKYRRKGTSHATR